jgi:polysaccharide pyruvyl transferase CsaB
VRIAVSGYYGAGNLGDEALLAGLLHGLAEHGLHDVTVLSADPAATTRMHGVRAARRGLGLPATLWRTQALVSGGGGLLQDVTSTRSLRYYLGVLSLARRMGRPRVVFGQSLGPLSQAGRFAVQGELAGVPIGLRDGPSLRLAQELGLRARHVGDTALLLAVERAPPRDAVVLVPRSGYPRATAVLADLGRHAIARGLRVEAAAFQRRADAVEIDRLRRALPELAVLDTSEPESAAHALSGARLVVSARLHGLVLAAAGDTAHAGISYDPKVEGFAAETGAPWWRVPADDAEHRATVSALCAELDAPQLDRSRVRAAKARAADGVRWLAQEALHASSSSAA